MCDACELRLTRRRLLRHAALTGGAVLLATPAVADAAAAGATLGARTRRRSPTPPDPVSPVSAPTVAPVGVTRRVPPPNVGGVDPPPIISRERWGADESMRRHQRAFAPIRKLVVHHTGTPNRPSDPADLVRYVYQYDTQTRGYSDIGYNFLIDHRGNIYEGRYSRRYGDEPITGEDHDGWGVVAAHAEQMNTGTCGICLIGDFSDQRPTDAALGSLRWLLAWKASRHRIDPLDDDPFVNAWGVWSEFPNVGGHRGVGFTYCPGERLAKLLPSLRQDVAGWTGRFDRLVVDTPAMVRYEWSPYGQSATDGSSGSSSGSSSQRDDAADEPDQPDEATTTATSEAPSDAGTSSSTVAAIGYRAVTSSGAIFTAGRGRDHGRPGRGDGDVVAIASPPWGDGYLTLSASGVVRGFGTLANLGDVSGEGAGPAVDLEITSTGAGYWILMADGGIYPFGDARYHGSPKRSGVGAGAVRMAARPRGDGYWVLGSDGVVRAHGAAGSFGIGAAGAVDIESTSSGGGYWLLLPGGEVVGAGSAGSSTALSGIGSSWKGPARAITRVPGSDGYVISSSDGGLFSFGGAPYLGSFAGSGTTVVGITTAGR